MIICQPSILVYSPVLAFNHIMSTIYRNKNLFLTTKLYLLKLLKFLQICMQEKTNLFNNISD
jgi:hypothetical protein